MQQKLQQFVFLSERILSETGELRLRRTWNELCTVSAQLAPYMAQLSQNFDPKYALLYLLSCGNEGTQKNGCFSMLFRKILSNIPNKDLFSVLNSVNRVELNSYLLPFLYEKGDIGSVAAYVAAKLGLKVNYDAFEFFLTSRDWSQEDFVNLSFLVLLEQRDSLILQLDNLYKTSKKEVFAQFLNVLNSSNVKEPVLPDLQKSQSVQNPITQPRPAIKTPKQPVSTQTNSEFKFKLTGNTSSSQNFSSQSINTTPKTDSGNGIQITSNPPATKSYQSPNSTPNNTKQQSQTTQQNKSVAEILRQESSLAGENSKEDSSNKNKVKAVPVSNSVNNFLDNLKEKFSNLNLDNLPDDSPLKQPPVLIVAAIVFLLIIILIVYFFSGSQDSSQTVVVAPPIEGKIPEYWVDAVSNRKITPQYIEADVDYRMGELYLSRNLYDEAIKFFSSALRIEPNHNIAKLRWGYTELLQGNYFVAKKLLKEVLAAEPKMRNVNLYLARNAFAEKDYDSAIEYYKKEYKNYDSLDVGMEYANFLANIGQEDDAMDFLSVLQDKNPGKMLILNASSLSQQVSKKTKTKG